MRYFLKVDDLKVIEVKGKKNLEIRWVRRVGEVEVWVEIIELIIVSYLWLFIEDCFIRGKNKIGVV